MMSVYHDQQTVNQLVDWGGNDLNNRPDLLDLAARRVRELDPHTFAYIVALGHAQEMWRQADAAAAEVEADEAAEFVTRKAGVA